MGNKKVIMIPSTDAFKEYVKFKNGTLRIAVYTEEQLSEYGVCPLEVCPLEEYYKHIFALRKNWRLVGVYTNENYSIKNKHSFQKLLKGCQGQKIDLVICNSFTYISEEIKQINETKIPIYDLKNNRMINRRLEK